MKWQEIREHYPQRWILIEATKAHSEANKRVLEQLAVVAAFPDSVTAMRSYAQLHREAPERELYVFHTSRKTLDITERLWLGIRGEQWWKYGERHMASLRSDC
jgi:hypothetical protein